MINLLKRVFGNRQVIASTVSRLDGSGSMQVVYPRFNQRSGVEWFRSWVYIASNIVASEGARVPLRLYVRNRPGRRKNFATRAVPERRKRYLLGQADTRPSVYVSRKAAEIGEDFEEVTEPHPAIETLSRANDHANGFDLTVLRYVFLQLTGNAYLHPVFNRQLGIPDEVWLLPSQWVEVMPSTERMIAGYTYGSDPLKRTQFEPDEVIHFKLPNPDSVYYGKGRVEAVWSALELHRAKRETDIAVFQNRGRPDWLAILRGASDQAAIDRFSAEMERKVMGTRKTGKFAAIGGDVDIKQLNHPPDDIGDPDRVLDEIAGAFGVPRAMLTGAMNVAGGGTEQADRTFMRGTVAPLLCMDEQQLNAKWLPLFGVEGDAMLAYDNPVPADRQFELERRKTLVTVGGITPNELRSEEGYAASDDPLADALLVNGRPLGAAPASPLDGLGLMPLPAEEEEPEPQAENIETTESTVLNGAQVTAATAIVMSVAAGEIPRDAGIGQLEVLFNLSTEQAERIMGSAGTSTPTTPNPNPREEARPEAPAPSLEEAVDEINKAIRDALRKHLDGRPLPRLNRENGACGCGACGGKAKAAADGPREEVIAPAPEVAECANALIPAMIDAGVETDVAVEAARAICEASNGTGAGQLGQAVPEVRDAEPRGGAAEAGAPPDNDVHERAPVVPEVSPAVQVGMATTTDLGRFLDAAFDPPAPDGGHGGQGVREQGKTDAPTAEHVASIGDDDQGRLTKADASDHIREGEPERVGVALRRAIARVLADAEARIAAIIAPSKRVKRVDPEAMSRIEAVVRGMGQTLPDAMRPYIERIIAEGGTRAMERVMQAVQSAGITVPAFDAANPAVSAAARRFTERLAGEVTEVTIERVRDSIARGIEAGDAPADLARRVRESGAFSPERAETIARSESARAYGEGAIEGWKSSGVVRGRVFQLAVGACPQCEGFAQYAQGKVFDLDAPMASLGQSYQGTDGQTYTVAYADNYSGQQHPACRCWMEPVLLTEAPQ